MIDPIQRRDKKLLAIHRELHGLYRSLYVIVQLEQPSIHGWIRSYQVADKIGAHHDRLMLEHILKVIGIWQWSKTPDFRVWRGGKRRKRRLVELDLPLKIISASRWQQRKYPEEWKRYFRLELTRHKRLWHPAYVFAHRGLFEPVVKPQIVTEITVLNPEVGARIHELDQWLARRNFHHRIDRLLGISKWRWPEDHRARTKERLAIREMRRVKMTYPEVDPASTTCRGRINLREFRRTAVSWCLLTLP